MALTVNDKTFDSGKGEIRWNATAAAIQKIDLSDKLNTEMLRRIGSQEVAAITDGEYEPEDIAVTLEQAVWITLLAKLPANGYGNARFEISAHVFDEQIGAMKINALKCRIVGVKDSIEAGPAGLMCELTIKSPQIVRNGKTLNRRVGTGTAPGTTTTL